MNAERDTTDIENILAWYPSLVSRARRIMRSGEDAEDVVQDVMETLLTAPHMLDGVERLGAWLTTMVFRRCVDTIRSRTRRLRREEQSGEDLVGSVAYSAEDVEENELMAALATAIADLPKEQRFVVEEHALGGRTFSELAESTGIPKGTLLARKRRAMGNIKATLQRQGILEPDAAAGKETDHEIP